MLGRIFALMALGAVLVGCGDADRSEESGARTPFPAYQPMSQDSFARTMTEAMYAEETAHLEMTAGPIEMSMDVRFGSDGDLAMAGTFREVDEVFEVVVADGTVYTRDEGATRYNQFSASLSQQMLDEIGMGDPVALAEDFSRGMDVLEYEGEDAVEGVRLHRYRLTMRDDFVADGLNIPIARVPAFEYRMWFDEDHLVQRMKVVMEGVPGSAEVRATRWGEPVEIEAPPESEVDLLEFPDV